MLRKMNKRAGGFTLVEIMIVVAIVALLAVIAVPNFLRARKRSQASRILEELRLIDAAKDQYAIEYNRTGGSDITWGQVQLYLKSTSSLYQNEGNDLFGNAYVLGTIDGPTKAHADTYTEFDSLNLGEDFWGGFGAL
jgi:prepilin-type N-terminal cleavage/methylation domain-containing protein